MARGKKQFVIAYREGDEWFRFDTAGSAECDDIAEAYAIAASRVEAEFKTKKITCDRSREAESVLVADGIEYKVFLEGDPSIPAA